MDLSKFNPWNWFKHEENVDKTRARRPSKHSDQSALPVHDDVFPHHPISQLHQQIDRVFDEALRSFGLRSPDLFTGFPSDLAEASGFSPRLSVSTSEQDYVVNVEIPGMDESDISVETHDGLLVIKGQKQAERESKDRHYVRIEQSYGEFQRVLNLPADANIDQITASINNGVLTITIPHIEASKSNVKKIKVQ